jgi:hypothetical protein
MSNGAFVEPDYKTLFEQAPGLYMILDPNLRIIAVSNAYLEATQTRRTEIVGRFVFDVFPEHPKDDASADEVAPKVLASFNRVLRTRTPDTMELQRYDVGKPESEGGGFEVRYWSPVNSPILNPDGSVAYIFHRVEDVTSYVLAKRQGIEPLRLSDEIRDQAVRREAELYSRACEVAESSLKLKQNDQEPVGHREQPGELVEEGTGRLEEANQRLLWEMVERQRAEDRLKDDLSALTRIHELSGRLLSTDGLQPLLQEIMDVAVMIAGADMGTLQLLEGDSLRIVASHGHKPPFLEFFALAEDVASVCGEATRRGERVVVADVETSLIFAGTHSLAVLQEAGVRAVQSTPMISRNGTLLGILTTQWKVPFTPDEHDLWRIDLLARQAADLIDQSRAEKELRRSEERFRAFVTASSDVVYRMSPDWKEMHQLKGRDFLLDTESSSGNWLQEYIHPDDRPQVTAAINKAIREKSIFELKHRVLRVDGGFGWTFSRAIPLLDANGEIAEWFGAAGDITEQTEMHRTIESIARFPAENPYPILRISEDGRLLYANKSSSSLLEFLDLEQGQKVPSDWRHNMLEALKSGSLRKIETECMDRAYSLTFTPIPDFGYVNVYGLDITERKLMEEQLRESKAQLEAALAGMTEAVLISDAEGRFVHINDAFVKYHRFRSRDECSRCITECPDSLEAYMPDGQPAPPAMWALPRALSGESAVNVHYTLRRKDSGETWTGSYSFGPIRDDGGAIVGAVVVARDVTEQKLMEEEIRKSRDELEIRVQERTAELERSNQALQEFAYIASHDMNEPLRKVISFGNMLRGRYEDLLGETGSDYLKRMLDATQRMQTMIKSLLEYSRLTSNTEPFSEVDLYDIVHEVLSDLEISIKITAADTKIGQLPLVHADPAQMRQLFQNLIGNALKFHKDAEKPVINIWSTTGEGGVQIFVEDNGIGFEEQYLDKIFQLFQRLHGRSSRYKGAGMGLAICNKIVERHGWRITAKSSPGEGSTFIISLPGETGRKLN